MSALHASDPALYARYGGNSFFLNPLSRFMLMMRILLGLYHSEISDPGVLRLAGQYRSGLIAMWVFLLVWLIIG